MQKEALTKKAEVVKNGFEYSSVDACLNQIKERGALGQVEWLQGALLELCSIKLGMFSTLYWFTSMSSCAEMSKHH